MSNAINFKNKRADKEDHWNAKEALRWVAESAIIGAKYGDPFSFKSPGLVGEYDSGPNRENSPECAALTNF